MENNREINLIDLLKSLLFKWWIILLAMIVFATGSFAYTKICITPTYNARVTFHVNNSSTNISGTVTEAELMAGKTLLETYIVILKSRTTLEEVVKHTGNEYSYAQLYSMVSASPVNATDILAVSVTSTDPSDAQLIANMIADILPGKIFEITGRSPIKVVDEAVTPTAPSSPSVSNNVFMGAALGFVASAAAILLIEIFNDKFRYATEITSRYKAPLLASIPDLLNNETDGKHSYYYKSTSQNNGGASK